MLQARYGKIVTYEETIIVYRPDLAVYGKDETVKWTLGPKRRSFRLVPVAGLWKASRLDGPLLSRIVAAYNQQNDGLRFRTEESKYGLHIIPARSRNEGGQDVAVSPLLDAQIKMFAGAFGVPADLSVTWGVKAPTTARAALIDLLGHSASSLSWHLNCQASARPQDRFCVLNITPVVLDVRDRKGKWVKKPLTCDRCVVCPQVVPPPPE